MAKHYPQSNLPDIKTIRFAALHLMNLHKEVTSNQLVQFLNKRGFLINKKEVNYWMTCLATKEGWEYDLQEGQRCFRLKRYPGFDLCCEALGFSSN